MSHFIYADHAATTAVSDTALQAMLPHFTTAYGNPSSLYRFAQEARPTWSGRGRRSPPASTPGRRRSTSPPAVRRRTTGLRGVAELMA